MGMILVYVVFPLLVLLLFLMVASASERAKKYGERLHKAERPWKFLPVFLPTFLRFTAVGTFLLVMFLVGTNDPADGDPPIGSLLECIPGPLLFSALLSALIAGQVTLSAYPRERLARLNQEKALPSADNG